MKKLLKDVLIAIIVAALILAGLMLFTLQAKACVEETGPRAVQCGAAAITYTDASWWALTEDCELAGVKDAGEDVPRMPVQSTRCQWVAGKLENGWMRQAGMISTVTVNGQLIGLTKLCSVSITLYAEYEELALSVVTALLGDDAELNAANIVSCAHWWEGDFAGVIFHPSYSDRFQVGVVTFNAGEDTTPLYLGHFGGDLRFGLACGWWLPEPEKEPETASAQAAAEAQASAQAQATAQASASAAVSVSGSCINQSGDGCWRNNTVIQINVLSIVKNCVRFLRDCAE